MELELWISVALIITLGYSIFGLTGFGATIVAMPMLTHFFPLQFAVPLMLVFDVCCTLLLGSRNLGTLHRQELLRLFPFMMLGMVLGSTLLVKVSDQILLFVLGCFILAYAGWNLLFRPKFSRIAGIWSVPLGTAGGIFSALFGTGGPLYAIYLASRIDDKLMLRSTIAATLLISSIVRLGLFTANNLYQQENLLFLAATLLPCAILGMTIGNLLHKRLPVQRIMQGVWAVLVLGGTSLVWRSV